MCVGVHACMYDAKNRIISLHIYRIYMHHICACIYMCKCVCVYTYMCVCIYIYIYICTRAHEYITCICMYACMYACTYHGSAYEPAQSKGGGRVKIARKLVSHHADVYDVYALSFSVPLRRLAVAVFYPVYVCTYVCVCICVCVCIYIHTYMCMP